MARYRAKYDAKGIKVFEEIDGEVTLDERQYQADAGYYVMEDIKPYKSMVTGEMISSRSSHKEHLKKHRMVEIGNEKIESVRKPVPELGGLKQRLHEVMNSRNYR